MRTTVFLMIFYFFSFGTIGVFFPYTPFYLKSNGFTGAEIGILLACIPLNKIFTTNIWTNFFVKSKNKTLFVISMILLSNFSLFFIWKYPENFWAALVSILFYSLFRSGVLPLMDTLTMEHVVSKKVSYGQIRMMGSIGFIVGSIITGKLIDLINISFFIPLIFLAGTFVIFPIFMLSFDKFDYKKHSASISSFDKNFYILILGVIIYFMAFSFNNNFINIKISESGLSQLTAGSMWSAGVLLEIVIMFFSGKFLHKASAVTWMQLSVFTGFFRWLLIGIYSSKAILYFACTLHGISFGLFHLAMIQYIKVSVPEGKRLKAQGIYAATAYGLGSILGSLFSGFIYDFYGVNITFLAASGISLISMIIIAKSAGFKLNLKN